MNCFDKLVHRVFGFKNFELNASINNPTIGAAVIIDDKLAAAKIMVVECAGQKFDLFLKNMGDGGAIRSDNFKGVEFHNQCDKDLNIAYKAMLKALLKETINEIDKLDNY